MTFIRHLLLLALFSTVSLIECLSGPLPVVYTIAGSDSGGGAGIQADLHAMHSMGVHGCSAIVCLTAQNSVGVTAVHAPPVEFLREQLETLYSDMPPRAVKVGMLGTTELALEVGTFLKKLKSLDNPPYIVVDPVMISTSGHRLIDEGAEEAMKNYVFPYADVLTPNKYEAEALLKRSLDTPDDVVEGAKEILHMGVKSVLIKGGHMLTSDQVCSDKQTEDAVCSESVSYAQDYFLSNEETNDRLCDGSQGVWLRVERINSEDTHGTGCTLSSVIASSLAIGHQQREMQSSSVTGAANAIHLVDACVLGKAYVTAGIANGTRIGKGPGPVSHTEFPASSEYFPSILSASTESAEPFPKMASSKNPKAGKNIPVLGTVLPVVDSLEWVETLSAFSEIEDIQLRIKGVSDQNEIEEIVQAAQIICEKNGTRLWVNDFWEPAIKAKVFGIHMGQEDLASCADAGGLQKIREAGIALGISTHSYAELAAALGVKPSYISLGPVFGTNSKTVNFAPQGLSTVSKWRELIPDDIPLVAIGGINDSLAAEKVKNAGAECIAVIGAVTKVEDVAMAVQSIHSAMMS